MKQRVKKIERVDVTISFTPSNRLVCSIHNDLLVSIWLC